jgi:hypothetical protein
MDDSLKKDELAAAEDFRRQLQERLNTEEPAGREAPLRWMDENPERLAKIISASWGPNADHTELRARLREVLQTTPLVTPHDEPFTHTIMRNLCEEIERTCTELGIPLRSGVAYGADPSVEIDATRYAVQFTDASVISLSRGFIRFCNHTSKMLALSAPHNPMPDGGTFEVCFDPDQVFNKVQSDPELMLYWAMVIGSYACGHMRVPWAIVPRPASTTRVQLLHAMERFAIAHEYAHHIAAHGRRDTIQAGTDLAGIREEFDADLFALSLTRYLGTRDTPQNLYSMSGAAAVLLLKTWECVRRARHILLTGGDTTQQTGAHPELGERIDAFGELDPHLAEYERQAFSRNRNDFAAIVDAVWSKLRPVFVEMHTAGLRPAGSELASWLPN